MAEPTGQAFDRSSAARWLRGSVETPTPRHAVPRQGRKRWRHVPYVRQPSGQWEEKADSGMILTPAQELKELLEEKINGDFQEYCGTCCGKTSKCDLHLP